MEPKDIVVINLPISVILLLQLKIVKYFAGSMSVHNYDSKNDLAKFFHLITLLFTNF